jgi:PAT family beta-lactamase induction signal transducer AmpG
MNSLKKRSPWAWIPTLYFGEGLPYVAVTVVSVILYKRLGVSNSDITLYTSWLYLPWVIKPLWSPFVDIFKTKRWWIITMQLLIGAGLAGVAFTIPVPFFFQATLAFFCLMAFSSATHDIAADGFYMLSLDASHQALYIGVRNTFYRVATITGQGVLIIFAGLLESSSGLEPLHITVSAAPDCAPSAVQFSGENSIPKEGELAFFTDYQNVKISTQLLDKDSAKALIDKVRLWNIENSFLPAEQTVADKTSTGSPTTVWHDHVSQPLGTWIKRTFGEDRQRIINNQAGNVGVVEVRLSNKPDEGDEVVLNTTMSSGDKSISMVVGDRLTFHAGNWDKPAYLAFQLDPKLDIASTAEYRGTSGNVPFAWSITFFVLAGLFLLFFLYHRMVLPRHELVSRVTVTAKDVFKEFGHTFKTFFKKPQAGAAIFFMLTYRFSEAQLLKLIYPFLLDSKDIGGLGLTTGEVGFVYGTIGTIGLIVGGIIGGIVASRGGLKKWLLPMTLSMLLTCLTFVYLSYFQTENLLLINIAVLIEQFGYGFGFTAYMLYLMYYADGEHKTSHYAICTGFMALGMMVPGMFAGWLEELLGYQHFFVWVMICGIVPVVAALLLKIDPNYGKKSR